MARLVILGPNQLGSNPRLVRNADCLAAAGHDVTVIYPDHLARFRSHDEAIIAAARWKAIALDFCRTPRGRLHARFARLRRRLAAKLPLTSAFARQRAYGYFGPELARAASAISADLYLAQQQMTVLPAVAAARAHGARFAVDVEDLVSDCTDEPTALVRAIENRHFPHAAFLTTMSDAAADRLAELHRLPRAPVVLHNCMTRAERAALQPPSARPAHAPLALYWFGQTVGPHACAEVILRAIATLPFSARLTLRGANPRPDYLAQLRALAAELRIPDALALAPGAPPRDMVPLAGEHDICFGTQPGTQLFHQLAIGNKVFTGMMAGCAVALTDTAAHRRLLAAHDGWAFTFSNADPLSLAEQLTALVSEPARLAAMRDRAWSLATDVYNCETESARLVAAVRETLTA
jgi:glycosyltransferase involved in cell wall biosynthesis